MRDPEDTTPLSAESRSIDYIPPEERFGKTWHIAPTFFMMNITLTTLAVGLLGIAAGGNLIWSLIAILTGILLGTIFQALHGSQGPHLGLPQMIQSRAQFGFVGAVVPLGMAVMLCVGLNIFNLSLGGSALSESTDISLTPAVLITALVAAILSALGYAWINLIARWYSYAVLVCSIILTVGAIFVTDYSPSDFDLSNFRWIPFLIQLGAVISWQLSLAPYVSDYTRYLPESVKTRSTVIYVYIGSALGGLWFMALGAVLLAAAPDQNVAVVLKHSGDRIFDGFGVVFLIVSVVGLIAVAAVNMYSGSLNVLTVMDSLSPTALSAFRRIVLSTIVGGLGLVMAVFATSSFLDNFNMFLTIMLYFMTPWTAVNLVDYFIIRKGQYFIGDLSRRDGLYRGWIWQGLVAYFAAFIAMIPFFSTSFYEGPVAKLLGGSDLSVVVGIVVGGGLYFWFAKRTALEEADLAKAEMVGVERSVEL
jgi:nucleobase:cation symporter-1, NCS1 family